MARLREPVVSAEPEAANPLGDARAAGADDHAHSRQRVADPVEESPSIRAEHPEVDHQRVQPHRDQVLHARSGSEHAVLPPHALEALGEHAHETAVGVDYRESYGCGLRGHSPNESNATVPITLPTPLQD